MRKNLNFFPKAVFDSSKEAECNAKHPALNKVQFLKKSRNSSENDHFQQFCKIKMVFFRGY